MVRIRIVILFLFFCPLVFMFQQDKYSVIFERLEVVRFNKSYTDYVKTRNFKYNRTQAAVNLTLHNLKNIYGEISVNIFYVQFQAYTFLSNEYRPFPIRFAVDLCASFYNNDFGIHGLLDCGNFSVCPPKKGWAHVCNFKPDEKKFPPLIPGGRYMIDLQIFHYSSEYIFYQAYGTVKYPEV